MINEAPLFNCLEADARHRDLALETVIRFIFERGDCEHANWYHVL